MERIAIDGINGAGKTPTITKTIDRLSEQGINADCYAPFHLVREHLVEPDIFPLWTERPRMAVFLLQHTLNQIETEARDRHLDVLIYDRHWMTVLTQQYQVPDIHELWGNRFAPTILLTSPKEHALRLTQRNYQAPWLQSDSLPFYIERYDDLATKFPELILGRFTVSSGNQDLGPIADTVAQIITERIDHE